MLKSIAIVILALIFVVGCGTASPPETSGAAATITALTSQLQATHEPGTISVRTTHEPTTTPTYSPTSSRTPTAQSTATSIPPTVERTMRAKPTDTARPTKPPAPTPIPCFDDVERRHRDEGKAIRDEIKRALSRLFSAKRSLNGDPQSTYHQTFYHERLVEYQKWIERGQALPLPAQMPLTADAWWQGIQAYAALPEGEWPNGWRAMQVQGEEWLSEWFLQVQMEYQKVCNKRRGKG